MADNIQVYLKKLRTVLDKYPITDQIEAKTHVKKEYIAAGGLAALFLFFLFGNFAGFLCNLTGFAYPAYMSFKAIESKAKEDDTQWLVYWVVYSFFTILETFVSVIVRWIPFYFAFKLAFLVWLFYPSTRGATIVYNNLIKDLLHKYEAAADSTLDKAKKAVDAGIDAVKKD